MDCWKEAYRVLRNNGEAYFFPINYSDFDVSVFLHSLEALRHQTQAQYSFIDHHGREVADVESAYTLRIARRSAS